MSTSDKIQLRTKKVLKGSERKASIKPFKHIDVDCPVEFFKVVEERGRNLPTASSERNKPRESAIALWRMAQGISLSQISEETGIARHALRALALRNQQTLNEQKERFAALYAMAAHEYSELLFEKADRMRDNPEQLDAITPDRLALTVGIMTDQAAKLSGMASTVIEHRTGASIEDAAAMIAAARARIAEKAKATAIEAEIITTQDDA